jgi:peptidoglycan/xylan/chitin deacetylase (PgdA/CDA1 family)
MYLPILTYHRLLLQDPTKGADPMRISVSQDQFRRHLLWLKRLGYQTIRLEDYVKWLKEPLTPTLSPWEGERGIIKESPRPRRGRGCRVRGRFFAATFDDGYEEVLTIGLPILQEFGFTATVFAVSSEERNRWDDGKARLMNAAQLRQWREAGMEVGAHSCTHAHLARINREAARREIRDSKTDLEQVLGQAVTMLAYPYGESNPEVEALAREAGFEAAFATDRAPRDHFQNLYRLRRSVVFPRNTAWEILIKAQRWYPAYQDWKRR